MTASGGSALSRPARPDEASVSKALSAQAEKLLPVLSPEQFFGGAAMGYAAAKAVPHVCHKIFCYCGCDITDSHSNLLDCFTSYHGADCHICQEEALIALKMNRDAQPLSAIQKVIDETYSSRYPFKEESQAYKKYKATRLWSVSGAAGAATGSGTGSSKEPTCCSGKSQR